MEKMLRVHLIQNGFGLNYPGMEEALIEDAAMRRFSEVV
ncbi:MAG: transposase, partial [Rhodocyclaceae bacterium]|nr:transposase [Rhodocyclaceae bacterium]